MKHASSPGLVSVLRLLIALIVLGVALPVAGEGRAQSARGGADPDLFAAAADVPGARFVHVATAANTSGNHTYIDHPLTNHNPNAIVLVAQNCNPGSVGDTFNDHPIGVYYSEAEHKWAVFNQDRASMPIGAAFNVLAPAAGTDAFVHRATAADAKANWTDISHPLANRNPDAIVLVTQNWNPGGATGTYNNHAIGVWYNSSTRKWSVFNQDERNMPEGASFNVLVTTPGTEAFVHKATSSNVSGHVTLLDHPLVNRNANAIMLVTQNLNPGGGWATYNDHPIGLWYSHGAGRWYIFNVDQKSIPEGASFNVLVVTTESAAFAHTANASSIVSNSTFIDHHLTNGNPDAIVFGTQNWNPGGAAGTYNDHPIGVWYSSASKRWAVFNQDRIPMPTGVAFNLLLPLVDASVFVHVARSGNIDRHMTYIDHPLTNDTPEALPFVTQNWNPSGVGNTYNDHPIGVWYSVARGRWSVFNQDIADMPEGAAFNVLVATAGPRAFVHRATASSITDNLTEIAHPLTNRNPSAMLIVTQNWNPGGVGNTYNKHPIGVRYYDSTEKWTVFNQDLAAMPEGAAFNIMVTTNMVCVPVLLRQNRSLTIAER